MFINQLSVFVNNEKGAISQITDILYKNDIDIRAIAVFDAPEFGICRLITDETEKACELLKGAGILAKISKVIAIIPPDEKGIFAKIYSTLSECGINVEYSYSFVMNKDELPYIVIKTDKQDEAYDAFKNIGIRVAEQQEI